MCVSVCKTQGEKEHEIAKHRCQGKCFVLWEFSSGCQAPVLERWGDVCTPPGRQQGKCDVGVLCRMCTMWVDAGWFCYFGITV